MVRIVVIYQFSYNQDVRAEYVSSAIESTTASATPVDLVDQLITQVAEEHALDVANLLHDAPPVSSSVVSDYYSWTILRRLSNFRKQVHQRRTL